MMQIKENYSLKNHNTFGIDVNTRYFVSLFSSEQIDEFIRSSYIKNPQKFILGGGSNVLFTKNFDGIVINPLLSKIQIIIEDADKVIVRVGSGIEWDKFVKHCVDNGWGGLENLSDIPGNVGAAPVQNIGAYGVEVKDCLNKVEGIHLETGEKIELNRDECQFAYRDSIFKNTYKNTVLISHVWFELSKKHTFITHYGGLEEKMGCFTERSIQSIREAVVQIRKSKLPDTRQLGSAGSFFKNPIVDLNIAQNIKDEHPDLTIYPLTDTLVKIPAGWLIEKSGLKGFRRNNVGTHVTQALVIVNYGEATGTEIVEFSDFIRSTVLSKFGVNLIPEVNFL